MPTLPKGRVTSIRLIVNRQKFVERVLSFTKALASVKGEVLFRTETTTLTVQTKVIVRDYYGFTFFLHSGIPLMGGKILKVWEVEKRGNLRRVLEVECWDVADLDVGYFNSSIVWQIALQKLMDSWEERWPDPEYVQSERLEREDHAMQFQAALEVSPHPLAREAKRLGFA